MDPTSDLPSDSIPIEYQDHGALFLQEGLIEPEVKVSPYQWPQDRCLKHLALAESVVLCKVHLLMQALPVTCACSTSVCWLGKHSYQKCTSITQAPTHKREWTLVSWKKKNRKEEKNKKSLQEQACEQSEFDEPLQIVHRMPCTRHLSVKTRRIITKQFA